jgi:hypothetical protein
LWTCSVPNFIQFSAKSAECTGEISYKPLKYSTAFAVAIFKHLIITEIISRPSVKKLIQLAQEIFKLAEDINLHPSVKYDFHCIASHATHASGTTFRKEKPHRIS